ncbi:unnamed protein product [Gordionus sp. m RMFG-2023]|uniref:magnesium-dependent phosphatase 1-like n=1 Tax=Gordionus sp. m RMFG-2023 TaxID=3053472 RepID=UPI0030E4F5D9
MHNLRTELKPNIIVFDLDDTLWPFHVDWTVQGPFHKKNGKVYDSCGEELLPYPDVPEILENLSKDGYTLAAASRTTIPAYAEQMLKLYDWNKYFKYKEIYPSCKVKHFEKIMKQSGISYEKMLFFDDEYRNIEDIQKLGVTCIYIKQGGLTKSELCKGLKTHEIKLKTQK